jgi:hypothetical protein
MIPPPKPTTATATRSHDIDGAKAMPTIPIVMSAVASSSIPL